MLDGADTPYDLACPLAEPDLELPGCVHSGWEVTVELSDVLSDETVAAYLDASWRPCAQHSPELIEEHAGKRWQYTDDDWKPLTTTQE